MTSFILSLILVAATVALGLGLQQLVSFVRGDGSGASREDRPLPRSHPLDVFDPRSRRA